MIPSGTDRLPVRLTFVVGCPRSGTSWVRNILDRHPEVTCGPESHLFQLFHDGLTSDADGAADWESVLARYDGYLTRVVGPHRWVERSALAHLLERAASDTGDPHEVADDLIEVVLRDYVASHHVRPGSVLVEKTPHHIFHAARILRRFPEAQIIEVRRDGRDVCVSMQHRATRVDWPPKLRCDQIAMWTAAVAEGLRCSADPELRHRWHVLRYEDLIDNRRAHIARMFEFLGLALNPSVLEGIVTDTHISRVVIAGDGEHVRKGAVGDWRTHFSADDEELFTQLAGDTFVSAGYRL